MQKTWLVTGSNRGLGLATVQAALEAGNRVMATARDLAALEALAAEHPDRLRLFPLDVTIPDQAGEAIAATIVAFGGIDVLVNNAGYGCIEPFETADEASFRDQVEVNFFGSVNLIRAVLPTMRAQRSGYIVNVASVGSRVATPGLAAYQAAKWAVAGFTEVLAKEVAGFGVNAIALEPGGMRTGWGSSATQGQGAILPDYEGTVGEMRRRLRAYAGVEVGDPKKIARVIVDLTCRTALPYHLILGSDALAAFEAADRERRGQAERWLAVSRSVDF